MLDVFKSIPYLFVKEGDDWFVTAIGINEKVKFTPALFESWLKKFLPLAHISGDHYGYQKEVTIKSENFGDISGRFHISFFGGYIRSAQVTVDYGGVQNQENGSVTKFTLDVPVIPNIE